MGRSEESKKPQNYVKIQPIDIGSIHGVKLLARYGNVYNAEVPSRQKVRDENYKRRLSQLSSQGFHALNYKPYKSVGDPFYLDVKLITLNALGQLTPSDDQDLPLAPEPIFRRNFTKVDSDVKRVHKDFIVLPPSQRDLQDIRGTLRRQRITMRNVRLGHGVFDVIKEERRTMEDKIQEMKEQERKRICPEWMPKKMDDSSDEDSDYLLDENEDLFSFLPEEDEDEYSHVPPRVGPMSAVAREKSNLSRKSNHRAKSAPIGRQNVWKSSKTPVPPVTPFTSRYVNMNMIDGVWHGKGRSESSLEEEHDEQYRKDTVFRQLCCLLWLLRSMQMEGNTVETLSPITTCWSLRSIGGHKVNFKDIQQLQEKENHWKEFVFRRDLKKFKQNSVSRRHIPGTIFTGQKTSDVECRYRPMKEAEQKFQSDKQHRTQSDGKSLKRHFSEWYVADSAQWENMVPSMKEKFGEANHEKSLILHEKLSVVERRRLGIAQTKYHALNTCSCPWHQVLGRIHGYTQRVEKRMRDASKPKMSHAQWFLDLRSLVSAEWQKIWYFRDILFELGKFAELDSHGEAQADGVDRSVRRLLKVLDRMTLWEICFSDFAAAVQYCREKVLAMGEEEYDNWLSAKCPFLSINKKNQEEENESS